MSLRQRYELFWTGFAPSDSKLAVFRLVFFSLFALDAWMQIGNAPRYGFGNFNVAHFEWLGAALPMPSRALMSVVYCAQVLLGLRIALGGARRESYVALAALFGAGYFVSQLNSYQHHYLLFLALCLLAAFPWPDMPRQPSVSEARHWPVRMLLVALSVMYCFAVVAKLDGEWLSGATLEQQLGESAARDVAKALGWQTASLVTIAVELALAVLLHVRRAWPLTVLLGWSFHLGIETSGLKIGLFSYFMLAFYLLALPDAWFDTLTSTLRIGERANALVDRLPARAPLGVALIFAAAATLLALPLDSKAIVVGCAVFFALVDAATTRAPVASGAKALVAALGLLFFVHATDGLRTYYHFWGHNDRRRGDTESAIKHYGEVTRIDPTYASGALRLANSYGRAGRPDEALRAAEAGLQHHPNHAKLNRIAAELYDRKGDGENAVRAAKRAARARPGDPRMQKILRKWAAQKAQEP